MALEIIQGEKQPYNIDLTSKASGKPFDLTGVSDITVCFKTDAIVIEKTLGALEVSIVGDPQLGQITGNLLVADTDSMTPTTEGQIEIQIDVDGAGDIKKSQILNGFIVLEKIC